MQTNTGPNVRRTIAAIILFAIGSVVSITLHVSVPTSEPLFAFLFAATVIAAFIVYFQDRIKVVDLAKLRFELDKIEATKNEVSELARLTVDFVLLQTEHLRSVETSDENKQELTAAIDRILELTGGSDSPVVARLHRNATRRIA